MTIWRPDPTALRRPAYLSLADQIARAIVEGKLEAGAQLPTQRHLAEDLRLSTQTVSRAYEELIRRGLLSGEIGRGTFVRPPRREPEPPYLPERLGEIIDLSILKPAGEAIHLERMKAGLRELADTVPASVVLSFRPNVVFPRHRAVAVEWLKACGLRDVAPGTVCLTNGATSAMTIALMTAAPPGSTVATEEIGHHTLVPLASYLGIKLCGIATDDEGILPDALERACEEGDIRAVFVQPSVINPMASLMGETRRRALVAVAQRHRIAIIENDVLGPLVEHKPPPLAALAPDHTLYITSFTKCVLPGLRIGYLVVPDRLVPAAANRHLVTNWMATPLLAELATRWIENGTAMELMLWQRRALHRRHAMAAKAFIDVDYRSHPNALHLWVPLNGHDESQFVAHARLHGVAVAPGRSFFIPPAVHKPAIRVSIGSTSEDQLRPGLERLAHLLRSDPEPALLVI
ncbi:PLP-dependent aminotransferase family protein [Rhodoligotrophos defluvii]|uniref:MocR-like ectoine utilization transcription factor EhuR n=1 Tax=Rhodoligotrophos defluvii TaxID=2561934 RepID=UPI0010C98986|nr:PLP-dependent aminotransferase family protein [Rhodoligotrophos defluvii]